MNAKEREHLKVLETPPLSVDEEWLIAQLESAEARAEALEGDIERAYSMLAAGGVSRERACSVANGIAVYQTRIAREIAALEAEYREERAQRQMAEDEVKRLRETVGAIADVIREEGGEVGVISRRLDAALTPPEAQGREEKT